MRPDAVLVTGSGGFVGRRVTAAMAAAGRAVTGTILPGGRVPATHDVRFVELDVVEPALAELIAELRPRTVVHLASRRDDTTAAARVEAVRTNVLGTANLIEAAAAAGVARLVHVTTSLEYAPSDEPLSEASRLAPQGHYAATKLAASLLVREAAGRIPSTVTLRAFGIYGPGQDSARFIPTLLRAAREGGEVELTGVAPARDWIHVDDVAAAIVAAAGAPIGEPHCIVNVGTGVQHTNHEVVAMAREVTGRPILVREGAFAPRPWDRPSWRANVTRLRELLRVEPRGLATGLAQLWEARAR